jgi:hypothetical protein
LDTEGRPTSISVSPANNNLVWVGTSFGWVYRFDFGANQITDFKNTLPDRYVSKVLASPNNANTVYVTYSGYGENTPTNRGKVFRSTNLGQNWTDISGNLPDVPVSSLALNPADENEMWVGTDIGVYVTTDGGTTWTSYRGNMPVVAIMDLKYNHTTGYLTVATHGRGIWRLQPHAAAATTFIRLPFIARGSRSTPRRPPPRLSEAFPPLRRLPPRPPPQPPPRPRPPTHPRRRPPPRRRAPRCRPSPTVTLKAATRAGSSFHFRVSP